MKIRLNLVGSYPCTTQFLIFLIVHGLHELKLPIERATYVAQFLVYARLLIYLYRYIYI